ncbi:MAG: OmpA family protein [Bacteroidales bacterium]|nr:OmpA family protein [Bacteroidales bacterium]
MKLRWTTLFGLLAMLHTAPLHSQVPDNMVYNPSFEEHTRCPSRVDALGVMKEADAWWQPTRGSSDYFHSCGGRETQVPRNKMGTQEAHSGEAYCGIYCSQENYREYLQTELKSPLQAGKRYRLSFWVSLADKSPHAVASIGALLTHSRVEDSTWGILMQRDGTDLGGGASQYIATYHEPQVLNPTDHPLDNKKEWTEVSGEFIAHGGERFLTLGNFLPLNKSHVVPLQEGNTPLPGAYYYIDDVSLLCLDSTAPSPVKAIPLPPAGTVTRLENLLFATGESELLQQSYKELRDLLRLMEEHPEAKIELRGHTDNRGTQAYNQQLSEARAKAVADYLIRHGIERSRIAWHGYGKSAPIDDNDTTTGRQRNRRVEYVVIP